MIHSRSRIVCAWAILGVIAAGLLCRSRWWSLPVFLAKPGGDALWAVVVFLGCGFLLPHWSSGRVGLLALGLAWAVEFSQLYHAPWIDGLRATWLGAHILGSTFNWPDLVSYAVGILLAALAERWIGRKLQRRKGGR